MHAKIGVNFKNSISTDILKNIGEIDIIEVYTERFFRDLDDELSDIINKVPLSLHGLDLSLGSEDEISTEYLSNLTAVLNKYEHEHFSDHLSMTSVEGVEVGHLMPISFTSENIDRISNKIKKVQSLTNKKFLLENITYYYHPVGSEMSEVDFFNQIIEKSDCGILLDVNNLLLNSLNHNYDWKEYLENINMNRIEEVHLAGGSVKFGMQIDTHANNISKDVWDLFEYFIKRSSPGTIIIERDDNIESYEQILKEVRVARCLLS